MYPRKKLIFYKPPGITVPPPPESGYAFWVMPSGMVAGQLNNFGSVDALGNISEIKDAGGTSIYAYQTTGLNQPALVTTTVLSRQRKVIRFAGNPQEMIISNAEALTNNISGATVYLLAKVNTGGAQGFPFFFSTSAGGTSRLDIRTLAGNTWQCSGRRLDADAVQTVAGASSTSAFKLVTGVVDFANSNGDIYENNTLINSNTSFSTDGNTSATNSALAALGSVIGSNYFNGDIALLLLYISVHTSTQRTNTWNWVSSYF